MTKGAVTLFCHFENESLYSPPFLMTICHFVRDCAGGMDMRSRFWLGYAVDRQKRKLYRTQFNCYPKTFTKQLAHHCAEEMKNLSAILPELYGQEVYRK